MSRTVNYDRHVVNLIDALSRTGHVTHNKYKKTSVTFHHNGGPRISHRGILNIWRTRPASAHFDSDVHGDLAQYVAVLEYAWAVGNTEGNMRTISIELANSSGAPRYEVAEATWKSGARLAGWLFANVIKARPTRHNVFLHNHWSSTSCPGPYMHGHYDELLAEVKRWYRHFHGVAPLHRLTKVERVQRLLEVTVDGRWGRETDRRATLMRTAGRNSASSRPAFDVKTVQRIIDVDPDGVWGPKSRKALHEWIEDLQKVLGVDASGVWGPKTNDAFMLLRHNHLISN